MATEMIPQGFRDTLTNWGTFIWSAPPPSSPIWQKDLCALVGHHEAGLADNQNAR
jgi:hypothetical protein